jgi:hypothetical protein
MDHRIFVFQSKHCVASMTADDVFVAKLLSLVGVMICNTGWTAGFGALTLPWNSLIETTKADLWYN